MSNSILIIAEIGINWRNMETAKKLIELAKENGADIAKFQLYDVDKSFSNKKIVAQHKNWYNEVKKTQLTKEQTFQLAEWCKEVDIEFMASASDLERLGWLEEVGVKRHKVGSSMSENKELIEAMLNTDKEVIISIPYGIFKFPYYKLPNQGKIKFLYCIPRYPTNLNTLDFTPGLFEDLKVAEYSKPFDGFSDHTIGIEASMIAMARGAKIIEKHFCLKRDNSNPDMICSIEPGELRQLVNFAKKVKEIL